MRRRPLPLMLLAALSVGIAASFYLQVVFLFGYQFTEFAAIVGKLTKMNLLLIALLGMHGMACWKASRWLLFTGVAVIAATIINQWRVWSFGFQFQTWQLLAGGLSMTALHSLILFPSARKVLAEPHLRWWRPARRHRLALPVEIETGGKRLSSSTFDISLSGTFIPLGNSSLANPSSSQVVRLRLEVQGMFKRTIICQGTVVRFCDKKGSYPAGIGVRFERLGFLAKLSLWTKFSANRQAAST